MIYKVFSVMDTKVSAFAAPFFLRSRGEAIRSFEDACYDDKLPFKAHPGDYRLFYLGEFDDSSGILTSFGPEHVIGADELIVRHPVDRPDSREQPEGPRRRPGGPNPAEK